MADCAATNVCRGTFQEPRGISGGFPMANNFFSYEDSNSSVQHTCHVDLTSAQASTQEKYWIRTDVTLVFVFPTTSTATSTTPPGYTSPTSTTSNNSSSSTPPPSALNGNQAAAAGTTTSLVRRSRATF
ncbi:unnamed protein product [Amoebophrya sp. A120]|nr:unnamed protein product [Amoebophrya sp. A120]|eukprot:GSA120T00015041001.1